MIKGTEGNSQLRGKQRDQIQTAANTLTYKRGLDALNHPDFYRQIGKDPQQVTAPRES